MIEKESGRQKDLGRDLNRSFEIMDNLLDCLGKFSKAPIKQGIISRKIEDEQLSKTVNKVLTDAFNLSVEIEDVMSKISGIRSKSSRFASERVISKFLDMNQ